MLQLEYGLGVEQVVFALAAPLVLAADLELAVRLLFGARQECRAVALGHVVSDLVQANAGDGAEGADEVLVEQALVQAHHVGQLGAAVARHRGDAHLGHDLLDAGGRGLDVVFLGFFCGDAHSPVVGHLINGLESHVRVDGIRTEVDEHGQVVHLAGSAGLDHQRCAGARLLLHHVVVHGAGQQQRRDRGVALVGLAVGEDQDGRAILDRLGDLAANAVDGLAQPLAAVGDGVQARDAHSLEGAQVHAGACGLGVLRRIRQVGQRLVTQNRAVQVDTVGGVRTGVKNIRLRTQLGEHAGDHLLAVAIQRRVGHLRETLREEVVQQARAVGQGGDRGIRTHRADALGTLVGHGAQQGLEVFLGVAEDPLAQDDALVVHGDRLGGRQVGLADQVLLYPLLVGLVGQSLLDFLVLHNAAAGGVDQEHLARLHAGALDDLTVRDVQHAGLGSHDDEAVLGDPDAARAQTVAVQGRADEGAVGEGDGGRAVPGLHEAGVVLVERTDLRVDVRVAFPRLRNHHQHGVRQAAAGQVQQLQGLVEAAGIRTLRITDRQHAVQIAQHLGAQLGLAGAHPVLVSADGVDLTVVCNQAVGVSQRPGREGVGGETRVHDGQRGLHALILQVQVELPQLRGGQHALVNDRAGGQGGEVHGVSTGALACTLGAEFTLCTLADEEGATVELEALEGGTVGVNTRDKELVEQRLGVARDGAQARVVDGHVAPADEVQALFLHDGLDGTYRVERGHAGVRQEGDAGGVLAGRRQGDVLLGHLLPVEAVGDLDEDAGAVAGVLFRSSCAAVIQVHQGLDALVHNVACRAAVHVSHEGDTTRIMLKLGVVKTLACRVVFHDLRPNFRHKYCICICE